MLATGLFIGIKRQIGRLQRQVQPLGLARLTQLVELLAGAVTLEGMAGIDQSLGVLGIDVSSLALTIRTMRAADIGSFVPFEPQPAQRIEDHLLRLGGGTNTIGVLDAKDELSPMLSSKA